MDQIDWKKWLTGLLYAVAGAVVEYLTNALQHVGTGFK